jgi:steroid 5-alpha reductase family enzyme
MLDRDLKRSKPGYAEYVASTSSFVPWLRRRAR